MREALSAQNPHANVLGRIKRGLAGYVSYLAACEMNQSFSEYVLYEPILRILTARGYEVKCEVACPGFNNQGRGDKKRLDFVATVRDNQAFAMEVKWAKSDSVDVRKDYDKLLKYKQHTQGAFCFLCVFGRKSHIADVKLHVAQLTEFGNAVYAEFGMTKYGCRIYVV